MIKITYGREYCDCTCEYTITISKPMTVREFIEEWMADGNEWGYFGIYDGETIFGNPNCEYSHGKIKGDPLPEEWLDRQINRVIGSGGWSRSDFVFELEGEQNEN